MNDQASTTNDSANDSCHLCEARDGLVSAELCQQCLTRTLVKHLPRLKRALELKHGAVLDTWLAEGKLLGTGWEVSDEFQVSKERVKEFLREAVEEAVAKEELVLSLPEAEVWKPIDLDQLVSHVYEQCAERLRHFVTGIIAEAVKSAPTADSERELVNIVSGRKRVRHRHVRERAIEALTLSRATPFTLTAIALIEMRYQADRGKKLYTELSDGKLSSVWEEIRDELPEEVAKFISEDCRL